MAARRSLALDGSQNARSARTKNQKLACDAWWTATIARLRLSPSPRAPLAACQRAGSGPPTRIPKQIPEIVTDSYITLATVQADGLDAEGSRLASTVTHHVPSDQQKLINRAIP